MNTDTTANIAKVLIEVGETLAFAAKKAAEAERGNSLSTQDAWAELQRRERERGALEASRAKIYQLPPSKVGEEPNHIAVWPLQDLQDKNSK